MSFFDADTSAFVMPKTYFEILSANTPFGRPGEACYDMILPTEQAVQIAAIQKR